MIFHIIDDVKQFIAFLSGFLRKHILFLSAIEHSMYENEGQGAGEIAGVPGRRIADEGFFDRFRERGYNPGVRIGGVRNGLRGGCMCPDSWNLIRVMPAKGRCRFHGHSADDYFPA